jgi:hypothetical protein
VKAKSLLECVHCNVIPLIKAAIVCSLVGMRVQSFGCPYAKGNQSSSPVRHVFLPISECLAGILVSAEISRMAHHGSSACVKYLRISLMSTCEHALEILHFGPIRTLRAVNGRSRGFIAPYHKPASTYLLLGVRKEIIRSLRSTQASGGTKSTSVKLRIHQDPDCAELCADPALATSRFTPSPIEGVNRRNRHGVGMG